MKICVYGSRGSIPFSSYGTKFGGNTSCMTIKTNDEELVLDAGSGLFAFQEKLRVAGGGKFRGLPPINILISHLHLDHIIGLGMFTPAWAGVNVRLYTLNRDTRPLKEQVLSVFTPPYWPKTMNDLDNIEAIEIKPDVPFKIGTFEVTPFLASHPDATISFHVTDGAKNFVHLLDSEYDCAFHQSYESHKQYFDNADLVVFDACYMPDDYPKYSGWGHSTVRHGVEIAKKWGVKLMMFSHFAPHYSDDELRSLSRYFEGSEFILARDGLEFEI